MDAREAKRRVVDCLIVEVDNMLSIGADWIYTSPDGEPLSPADTQRMEAAVLEVRDELIRRTQFRAR